jgi:iron complex transport system substrate-binding protein
MATLAELAPDVIVTQSLCGVCAVAEDEVRTAACLLPRGPLVINLEPETLSEVFLAIRQVGRAVGVNAAAEGVIDDLRRRVEAVISRTNGMSARPRVVLLEWLDPPFSCGHWTPELVRLAGGVECLGREGAPSRTLRWDEVISAQPEVVLIACCGFGVERTMEDVATLWSVPGWRDLPAAKANRVWVVDGSQYFSRPGPRLVDSLEILASVLDPNVHPLPDGRPAALRTSGVEELRVYGRS